MRETVPSGLYPAGLQQRVQEDPVQRVRGQVDRGAAQALPLHLKKSAAAAALLKEMATRRF
jgi:hypothetical protein